MVQRMASINQCLSVRALALAVVISLPVSARAQLSQNSGTNSSDTWTTFDLTTKVQATIGSLSLPTSTSTYHVELGYDSNGQIIANVWPTGSAAPGTDVGAVSVIRLSGGNLTVFDQNGAPIPYVSPGSNLTTYNPLSLLGTNPGRSVVQRLVVANIQQQATKMQAEYTTVNSTYVLTTNYTSGPLTKEQWTYVSSGSQYVATQAEYWISASNFSGTRTLQFANLHWNDNSADDTARTNAGYTVTNPPAASTSTPPAMSQSTETGCPAASSNQGGTQNVAYQYGLFSSSCSWKRMVPWLNDYFRFGTVLAPNHGFSSTLQPIATQGGTLKSDITSAGGGGYIVIGQSQGGLVSRYAAQQFQAANLNQTTVKGVVTLDTPNLGAPLANWAGLGTIEAVAALINYAWQAVGCSPTATPQLDLCYAFQLITGGLGTVAVDLEQSSALGDLQQGSSFVTNLNNQTESSFQKAGLVGHTKRFFVEVRDVDSLACGVSNAQNCYPEQEFGERNVSAIYTYVEEAVFVAWFIAIEECDPTYDPFACSVAEHLLPIWLYPTAVDLGWNYITTVLPNASNINNLFGDEDGVVPTFSQNYPTTGGPTALQYSVKPSDSHMGDTKSKPTRDVLAGALANLPFSVQTQASCTFSGPSPPSLSGNGGSETISLSTQTGCRWNSESQTPWILITSPSNGEGTSSGSIGFTAFANPQTIPRTGSIVAGNGTSSVTFTVQEAGACYYTLSEGPVIAIQPSGGTYAVSVTATSGCVWSAVSNTSWITISAGASGTGSGSFSFTATPNSGASDLTGTITVMNQTLTVIIGTPQGTPSTGSVTISGSGQKVTINPCEPHSSCPQTIPNGGSITVTVGSESFTVGYSCCSDTASSLATALATKINSTTLAPIEATVSGSKVTITSTINGVATNYPLSVSYTYNSTYFTSPAFTASASGPSLTGGTD